MTDLARWPGTSLGTGMYESFYLRAVNPEAPVSIWIRFTVQKAAGGSPKGSIWFTLFDETAGRPVARKFNSVPVQPENGGAGWIRIGDSVFGPGQISGEVEGARWSIDVTGSEPQLRHLPHEWMYRSPIPKTKPESPVPLGRFSGSIECDGRSWQMDDWPGMLGHNWGAEHAWTWVWLNGTAFKEDPDCWIDVALGRIRVAGLLLPWVANGAISIDGKRHRLGGLPRRGVRVEAEPGRASIDLPASDGRLVKVSLSAPRDSTVAWEYASPRGHRHDVLNCSLSEIEVEIDGGSDHRHLSSAHGGTYELGLPERQHWVELEPLIDEW